MAREVLRAHIAIRYGAACITDTGTTRVRAYQADRRCMHEGCTTVLSIYNSSSYCSLHERRQIDHRARQSSRQLLTRDCANAACNAPFLTSNPARVYCSDRCRMSAFQQRRQAEKRRLQAQLPARRAAAS
jgi:endogenous inhibitor of DNA gyrase (YacG/DUF329 family)